LLIKAGRLLQVESGQVVTQQYIEVTENQITNITSTVEPNRYGTIIDLSDYTVLPGLFDAHSHLCTDVELDDSWRGKVTEHFTSYCLQTTTAYRAIVGVQKAKSMLASGFTTVRDMGNAGNYADTDLRRAVENGLVPGPTILNSGRIISPFGGQFSMNAERPEMSEPEYIHADTREELRKAIRENVHFGAKVIKLVVDAQPYIYSVEDLKYIVEEARRAGVRVAAHCHSEEAARNCAIAGVASIEHGTQMSDETIALAKENGVVLVGTEAPRWIMEVFGSEGNYKSIIDRLNRAYRAGLTLAYGSDMLYEMRGMTRGEISLASLECWTEAGIPNSEILKAMTLNAATLLGVESRRGSLQVGLAADIIAVKGNPLENLERLKEVVFVMKDGVVIRNPS